MNMDMSTTNPNPNKPQRLSPCNHLHINDIPDEALSVVAKFLLKPSQAIFAVAMTAPSNSLRDFPKQEEKRGWHNNLPSAACQAILSLNPTVPLLQNKRRSENWATLDFADIDSSLARRLSDDDVYAILICIDAVRNLKTLKLTGCVNITGSGLKPLCSATVLKQVDLSLVGKHESPNISPPPRMSEDVTIPILEGIINTGSSSLMQLQLPKKFRQSEPSQLVDDFVSKYDSFLEYRGGACTKCNCEEAYWGNENINGIAWFTDDEKSQFYGCQNFTCYECTEHFCIECVMQCMDCEKAYCADCVPILECESCGREKCRECWAKNNCVC